MKCINIIHYHLLPGGVTSVIRSQIKSLKQYGNFHIRLITGQCPDPGYYEKEGVELLQNEVLDYLFDEDHSSDDLTKLYQRISDFLHENIDRNEIIHFHNLNLGKNPVLTYVIYEMASEGYSVVNHAHDFAEDRPDRMRFLDRIIAEHFGQNPEKVLYPGLENYHYITLNNFDNNRIIDQGIDKNHVHFVPNPVGSIPEDKRDRKEQLAAKIRKELALDEKKKMVVYPVRAIRRKNIGEFILLSVILGRQAEWLITQPPKNPVEIQSYKKWLEFCIAYDIPVVFEAGDKADFPDLMYAADICITTSRREGFGLVFIEPWLFGTPVAGRDIPYVTGDLLQAGMEFPLLYKGLSIFEQDNEKDFADLGQEDQMEVIRKILSDHKAVDKIIQQNPFIDLLLQNVPDSMIDKNMDTIKNKFTLEKNKQRLHAIYRRASEEA